MKDKDKYKKVIRISFIVGIVIALIYFLGIIMLESKNYSSLNISKNLGFMIVVSILNGLFYALFSYLFLYFRNKFTNNLKWIAPLVLTVLTLVVYVSLMTAVTVGFIIALTGF